jgi:hypothetical protein
MRLQADRGVPLASSGYQKNRASGFTGWENMWPTAPESGPITRRGPQVICSSRYAASRHEPRPPGCSCNCALGWAAGKAFSEGSLWEEGASPIVQREDEALAVM